MAVVIGGIIPQPSSRGKHTHSPASYDVLQAKQLGHQKERQPEKKKITFTLKTRVHVSFSVERFDFLYCLRTCTITRSITNGMANQPSVGIPAARSVCTISMVRAREMEVRCWVLVSTCVIKNVSVVSISLTLKIYLVKMHKNKESYLHWGRSWKQSQMPEFHSLFTVVMM